MAFTGIMCTEADIDARTGANVSTSFTDTMKTAAVLCAESIVNSRCGFNFSDVWTSTINIDTKYIITDIVASLVAIQAVCYDMSGYTTRTEAENIINVLRDSALRGLGILGEQSKEDFVNAA